MERATRTVRVAVLAAVLGCLAPAAAMAGTSSWSQPGDFTTDAGATGQWSYVDSATPGTGQTPPSAVGPMQPLSPTSGGWQDSTDSDAAVGFGGATCPRGYSAACDAANVTLDISASRPPTVTLNPLGPGRLTTGAPTLSGTAGTAPGDEPIVYVGVFAGAGTSGKLVRLVSVPLGADGTFSVAASPALPDGEYTALAGQNSSAGASDSQPVIFFVKAQPPALSVLAPRQGAAVADPHPTLSGAAGAVPGDAPYVTVLLFTLDGGDGQLLGRVKVPVTAGRWSLRWAHALPLGLYTAEVEQGDDVGHVSIYVDRFLIVPSPHRRARPHPVARRHPAKRR